MSIEDLTKELEELETNAIFNALLVIDVTAFIILDNINMGTIVEWMDEFNKRWPGQEIQIFVDVGIYNKQNYDHIMPSFQTFNRNHLYIITHN